LVNAGDEAAREVMSGDVLAVPVDGGDMYEVQQSTVDSGAWSLSWIAPWNNDEERPEKLQAPGGVSRGRARRLVTGNIRRNGQRAEDGRGQSIRAGNRRHGTSWSSKTSSSNGSTVGLRQAIPTAWRRFERGKEREIGEEREGFI
jgi:hypothetical protein